MWKKEVEKRAEKKETQTKKHAVEEEDADKKYNLIRLYFLFYIYICIETHTTHYNIAQLPIFLNISLS